MSSRAIWAGRVASFLIVLLLERLVGVSWTVAGLTAAALQLLAVQRARASDLRRKNELGLAVDAPIRATRMISLGMVPDQALELVAGVLNGCAGVSSSSVRVDWVARTASARVRPSRDGRLIFFGERLRVVVAPTEDGVGSRLTCSSASIVPGVTDGGKNVQKLAGLAQAIWQAASALPAE